jgi:xylose isomerase
MKFADLEVSPLPLPAENAPRFARPLNSFRVGERNGNATMLDLVGRAAQVAGLNCVDLNLPDHLTDRYEKDLVARMQDLGVSLNGYAMRYYDDEANKLGAFTHPDLKIRPSFRTTCGCATSWKIRTP